MWGYNESWLKIQVVIFGVVPEGLLSVLLIL